MTDSKFANLPGIAYDQPDTYETADVPEQETSDYYEEELENESIERLHLSSKDAYNKFRGKYLTGYVDFSDRLGKKLRIGYDARSAEWELAGDGEKETPLQKYRRLQCEMNELFEEITLLQTNEAATKEEKQSYEAVFPAVKVAKKVLESLEIGQVLGKEVDKNSTENEMKALINQVEEFKKTGNVNPIPEVNISTNSLAQSTRIAELEHRLHLLETTIGAKPEKLARLPQATGASNLLEAVQQLSTKAALLQPNQLDLIEARLSNLITKMDTVAEKAAPGSPDTARDQKTLELYEIAKRTEPITQLLPDMLNRMKALESLHKYATNISKVIAELDLNETNILTGIANNKILLQNVQDAFARNFESMSKEIAKVEERLNNIPIKK